MEEVSLYAYVNILARRKFTVIAVTLLVLAVAGVILALLPRTYEGQVTLLFPESKASGLGAQFAQLTGIPALGAGASALSGRNVYSTVLQSRTISEKVCQRLGLAKYGVDHKKLLKQLDLETPKEGGLKLRLQVPTSWVAGHVPRSELGRETAELAARTANAFTHELTIYDRANALFAGKKHRLFLEEQVDRAKEELRMAEARLKGFQERNPTLMPPSEASAYTNQALGIVTKQVEVDVALQEVEGELARARMTWERAAPQDISPEAVIDSPVISALRSDLAKLEVRYHALLEDFTENHPEVVALRQQMEKTEEGLRTEVSRIVSGKAGSANPAHQELLKQLVMLEVNRDGLNARKAALHAAMSTLESRLAGLPEKQIEYTRLLRDVKAAETVYTTLLTEHAKARVVEAEEKEGFLVLDEAIPASKPVKPKVLLTIVVALALGLMTGTLLAIVQEGADEYKRRSANASPNRSD